MARHEKFSFKTLAELKKRLEELGLEVPLSEDTGVLGGPARWGRRVVPNRMAVLPMEGCDADEQGGPGELTRRRYARFAAGGAGLIWVEACAVTPEGRTNPRHLWIHDQNVDAYRRLVELIKDSARDNFGSDFRPVLILQLTHGGRKSRPVDRPEPVIVHHSIVDGPSQMASDAPLVTDEYLRELQEAYVRAAGLAERAGFDGVDVKACNGYLVAELLQARSRPGEFGGSFENRARFLLETVGRIRREVPGLEVTSRLSLYDGLEYPHGWGVDKEDAGKIDLTEPLRLIAGLESLGCAGLGTTMGNPYYDPHLGRPFDRPVVGAKIPAEHPLEGVARLAAASRAVQEKFPKVAVLGAGYSWLRQLFPYLGAGLVEAGWVTIAGLGRGALAYPDFARAIIEQGGMEPGKCCVTCSGCTQLMRYRQVAGCIVRDQKVYGPIYRRAREESKARG